jgi:orotidine-5'-phosphate decarboxylase
VSFFKVGLELIVSGVLMELVEHLESDEQIFVDLKMPTDIPETIKRTVRRLADLPLLKFLTMDVHTTASGIEAAREGRGKRSDPKLLLVTYTSSLDEGDLQKMFHKSDLNAYISDRAQFAKFAQCDGVIASGEAIRIVRLSGRMPLL